MQITLTNYNHRTIQSEEARIQQYPVFRFEAISKQLDSDSKSYDFNQIYNAIYTSFFVSFARAEQQSDDVYKYRELEFN